MGSKSNSRLIHHFFFYVASLLEKLLDVRTTFSERLDFSISAGTKKLRLLKRFLLLFGRLTDILVGLTVERLGVCAIIGLSHGLKVFCFMKFDYKSVNRNMLSLLLQAKTR